MTKRSGDSGISRRGILSLAGAGLVLSASASSAPSALYELTVSPQPQSKARRRAVQVLVPRPRALKALDTDRIAVVEHGGAYSYYPGSAWTDALPNVVQSKIVESLESTGGLRGVGFPGDGLLIDFQLQCELRSFALYVEGNDRGTVEIAAKLVNDRNGRTVDSQTFTASTPVHGDTADAAVEALNISTNQVLAEITAWVLKKV